MQKFILFLGIFLTPLVQNAQTFEPQPPLDIPLVLSGTFAELRGNHFHGGIDIKTQGRSGLKVYSVADGYVSRIAVSPYGYGNALYIRHPEGYTSVYGHLNAFAPEIEQWVEDQFRDRSKNDGNLYPSAEQFTVSKGEFNFANKLNLNNYEIFLCDKYSDVRQKSFLKLFIRLFALLRILSF